MLFIYIFLDSVNKQIHVVKGGKHNNSFFNDNEKICKKIRQMYIDSKKKKKRINE
jgi:hypothetical protein